MLHRVQTDVVQRVYEELQEGKTEYIGVLAGNDAAMRADLLAPVHRGGACRPPGPS